MRCQVFPSLATWRVEHQMVFPVFRCHLPRPTSTNWHRCMLAETLAMVSLVRHMDFRLYSRASIRQTLSWEMVRRRQQRPPVWTMLLRTHQIPMMNQWPVWQRVLVRCLHGQVSHSCRHHLNDCRRISLRIVPIIQITTTIVIVIVAVLEQRHQRPHPETYRIQCWVHLAVEVDPIHHFPSFLHLVFIHSACQEQRPVPKILIWRISIHEQCWAHILVHSAIRLHLAIRATYQMVECFIHSAIAVVNRVWRRPQPIRTLPPVHWDHQPVRPLWLNRVNRPPPQVSSAAAAAVEAVIHQSAHRANIIHRWWAHTRVPSIRHSVYHHWMNNWNKDEIFFNCTKHWINGLRRPVMYHHLATIQHLAIDSFRMVSGHSCTMDNSHNRNNIMVHQANMVTGRMIPINRWSVQKVTPVTMV